MNRNNSFVKFAHFYLANIKGMKDDVDEIWDEIIYELLPSLLKIFCNILIIISRIIFCFLPIKQILCIFATSYLIVKENGSKIHSGYYLKKDLEKWRDELEKEGNNVVI
jgi:hypothetical protein